MKRLLWRKYGLLAVAALMVAGLSSCKRPQSAPADLLPVTDMAGILGAVYLAEVQAVRHYDLKMQKDEYLKYYVYPALFDSLGVSDSVFFRSYAWYENRPELLETLMDSVIVWLEAVSLDSVRQRTGEPSLDDKYRELYEAEERLKRVRPVGGQGVF